MAEQIVFGAVTTGAASDLQRVEEITHAMIHQYAMGSGDAPQAALKDQALSDLTRRIRDEEQRELAFEAHRGAWDLITTHRELLDRIAAELLENETLERAQIDRIMEGVPRIERRKPLPDLRIAAAEKHARSRRLDSGRDVRPGRPHRRRRRGPRRRDRPARSRPTAWPSRIARSSRSRASRPCCSTSARTTSSCCAR